MSRSLIILFTNQVRFCSDIYSYTFLHLHFNSNSGHFAEVYLATDRATGEKFAVKVVDKENLVDHKVLDDEVKVLRAVGKHPYIVNLIDSFEDENYYFLVMD
jgi:calcium-dependent protein kinase